MTATSFQPEEQIGRKAKRENGKTNFGIFFSLVAFFPVSLTADC
jgi:hypothetical protein